MLFSVSTYFDRMLWTPQPALSQMLLLIVVALLNILACFVLHFVMLFIVYVK